MLRLRALAPIPVILLSSCTARAGRPSLTDDAGVVGRGAAQIESWLRLDRVELQHWIVAGYGPLDELEVGVGVVHGTELEHPGHALAGPALGFKALAIEPVPAGPPGLALAAGLTPPWGYGGFESADWGAAGHVAVTESPFREDRLLFHGNAGVARVAFRGGPTVFTWGGAALARVHGPAFAFLEVVSGEPSTAEQDGVVHLGLKVELTDSLHLDATFGAGVFGHERVPPFATVGARWASN